MAIRAVELGAIDKSPTIVYLHGIFYGGFDALTFYQNLVL